MATEKVNFKSSAKLLLSSLAIGVLGGVLGAVFSISINLITNFRLENGWLICFLPVCAVAIVFIYKKLGIDGVGTNQVIKSACADSPVSAKLTFGIFITSVISHIFGASVGREGAALQIGGGIATFLSKIFRLTEDERRVLLRAGMAAVFSAVFGTPLTAFLFALEVVFVGRIHLKSVLPSFIASFSAYGIALLIGIHPERFYLTEVPAFSGGILWRVAILTLLCSLLSILFCYSLRYSAKFVKRCFKNPYIRIIVGGAVILLLTALVGNQDYNGAGIGVIERIFKGGMSPDSISFRPEAFILKLVFTCISVAAGFKGGEIVPTLFIGATFGALLSACLGLPIPFGAALCMVLLFCGVTNCPLASVCLAFELFSGVGFWFFVPTVAVCFILSGKISLYSEQKRTEKFTLNIFKGEKSL